MSDFGKPKDVYNNGLCTVTVIIRPDKQQYGHNPETGECKHHFLYAAVYVYSQDRLQNVWGNHIFPWIVTEYGESGWLWWKRKFVVLSTTAAERLEQAVIDAIRFADKYAAEYRNDTQDATVVLDNIQHIVEARNQLHELEAASEHP